jgi:hypothetical protein
MIYLLGITLAVLLTSPIASAKGNKGGPQGKSGKHAAKVEKREDKAEKREDKAEKHEDKAEKHAAKAENRPVRVERRAPARDVIVIDRDGNRRIVTEYYRREGLPPGLAKRDSLPPGLAKQLRERGQLPPGLQKRLTPVPQPLLIRLPAAPPYYARYFAGRDLVVVDTRTNRVAAIIRDVFPR